MVAQKYDIPKSFKLSFKNLKTIERIQLKKGLKNNSETLRFCINGDDRVAIAKLCDADYDDIWLRDGGLPAWLKSQEQEASKN